MMEKVDEQGRWESDDGAIWFLVEPSSAAIAAAAQRALDEPHPDTVTPATVAQLHPITAAARIVIGDRVRDEALTATEVEAVAALFPPWRAGETVAVGDLRAWDGTVVECLQAHTTQADWTPDSTPALWKVHRDAGGDSPDAWVQPTGGHDAYRKGDRVTHGGKVWTSTIDGNVWEPGVHGWAEVG